MLKLRTKGIIFSGGSILKIRTIKITIDILMFLILIFEMIPVSIIPVPVHFIGGLVFAVLFLVHILLNSKWCVSVTKALIKKKANQTTKRQYLTDWLLLIVWSLVTLTGLPTMGYSQGEVAELIVFRHIHVALAILGCVLIIIHIYQHRKQIHSYVKGCSK